MTRTGSTRKDHSRTAVWLSSVRRALSRTTAIAGMVSMVLTGPLTAQGMGADITAAVGTTSVSHGGGVTTVTTTNIQGTTAFNQFDSFNVGTGLTANVVQPIGTGALVNIIEGGGPSVIDGTLNAQIATGTGAEVGGNHFYVNRDGFVVSGTGTINAGALTMSTPTQNVIDVLKLNASGLGTIAVEQLFAGTEALEPGADIQILGTINARRLELRAGARLLMDGTITVEEGGSGAGGRLSPAVNADGVAQAEGLVMEGGVVRLLSKSEMRLRGQIKAKRRAAGGVVTAEAGGALTTGGEIDVRAAPGSALDSGSVILFTEATANLEAATKIDARSTAGSGGTVSISAKGKATVRGSFETAGGAYEDRGSTVVLAQEIETLGRITTGGGDFLLFANDNSIAAAADNTVGLVHLGGTGADTTQIDTTFQPVPADPSQSYGGDVIVFGDRITNTPNMFIVNDPGTFSTGGLIALIAQSGDEITDDIPGLSSIPLVGNSFKFESFIDVDNIEASVTLDQAILVGGAVVINAQSRNASLIDDSFTEDQARDLIAGKGGKEALEVFGEDVLDFSTSSFFKLVGRLIPVGTITEQLNIDTSNSTSSVTMTDVQITSAGSWSADPLDIPGRIPFQTSDDGVLGSDGLATDFWIFAANNPTSKLVQLPSKFAAQNAENFGTEANEVKSAGIYIHSHAGSNVKLGGTPFLAGLIVTANSTDSRVSITGGSLNADGNVTINSTAHEKHALKLSPIEKGGGTAAMAIAVRDLTNQARVDGTQVGSNLGSIDMNALSGRNHEQNIKADGGSDGTAVVAVNLSFASAFTEAAVGGGANFSAPKDINVNAETIYYSKRHDTNASLGLGTNLISEAGLINQLDDFVFGKATEKVKGLFTSIAAKIQGKTEEQVEEEDARKKPRAGFGLAFDLQLDSDDTFAGFGGSVRDLEDDRTVKDMGAATAFGGALNINANMRFALEGEGGRRLRRDVSSTTGINFKPLTAIFNKLTPAQKEETKLADLPQEFTEVLMFSASVSNMEGDTVAELGKDAIVQTRDLNVIARTILPTIDPFDRFVDNMETTLPALRAFIGDPTVNEAPSLRDVVFDIQSTLNPAEHLTTLSTARAVAPNAGDRDNDAKEQKFSLGLTLTVFNTAYDTRAVVREGAAVQLQGGSAVVDASILGQMLHLTNFPTSLPGNQKPVQDAIGGAAHLVRMQSNTIAEIEGDTFIFAPGNVTVNAKTDLTQGLMTYSGGGSVERTINGALGIAVMESDTQARIDGMARVTGDTVAITATDDSTNFNTAGADSTGPDLAVGVSVPVNFATRSVFAGIGAGPDATNDDTAGNTAVEANTLTITATNTAMDIALGVAGARSPTSQSEEEDFDTGLAEFLSSDEEFDEWLKQKEIEAEQKKTAAANKEAARGGAGNNVGSKTGWAVAGTAALNLSLGNKTLAEISTPSAVNLRNNGAASIMAINTGVTAASTGAVSIGQNSEQDTRALAGSFSIAVDRRDVIARVKDATIEAGSLTVKADDNALVVNIAVGGAGSNRGSFAVAGSVAVATLTGETLAEIVDGEIDTGTLTLDAVDASMTIGLAGALGINLDKQKGSGAGIAIAVNSVLRGAVTRIAHGSDISTGALIAKATTTNDIFAFAISAAKGQKGFGGSLTVNTISADAVVRIGALKNGDDEDLAQQTLTADTIDITVSETNRVFAGGGALALGGGTAVGGAIVVNTILGQSGAELVNTAVVALDTNVASHLRATVTATSRNRAIAVAASVATKQGNALGVGAASNVVTSAANLSLEGSKVLDTDEITLKIANDRFLQSLGGGAALSSDKAGGGAVTLNLVLGNDAIIKLKDAALSASGNLTVEAKNTGEIQTLAAGVSGGQNLAVAVTGTANVIKGQTGIDVENAELDSIQSMLLNAEDSSTITALAGGAALSGKTGVGAAVAVNVTLNDTFIKGKKVKLSGDSDSTLLATNSSSIQSAAVGLGGSGKAAIAGSVAIGDIGNTTRIDLEMDDLDLDGGLNMAATGVAQIDILAGGIALGGKNAVGAALTVAVLHNDVSTNLTLEKVTTAGGLTLASQDFSEINALAIGGAASGSNAVGASIVVTQVGSKPAEAAAAQEVEGDENGKPVDAGQKVGTEARGTAAELAIEAMLEAGDAPADADLTPASEAANEADTVATNLTLKSGTLKTGAINVSATRVGEISSLAGAAAISGQSSAGAAVGVNLLYGTNTATIKLPVATGAAHHSAGLLSLTSTQNETITAGAIAGAGGGTNAGAGAILVNSIARKSTTLLETTGGRSNVRLLSPNVNFVTGRQTGDINALAVVLAAGGQNGVGGAVAVNALSDTMTVLVARTDLDATQRDGDGRVTDADGGVLFITADRTVTLDNIAVSGSVAGGTGFAGSAAFNVVGGSVATRVDDSNIRAQDYVQRASTATTLSAIGGAVAFGANTGIGAGLTVNTADTDVTTTLSTSSVTTRGGSEVTALSQANLDGIAVAGAASATVAIAGSVAVNTSSGKTKALITDSFLYAGGNIHVGASAATDISLKGGSTEGTETDDSKPQGFNISIAVGGKVGVGASVSVNNLTSETTTEITGSELSALGLSDDDGVKPLQSDDDEDLVKGVVVEAITTSDLGIVTASGGAAVFAGISGIYVYNKIDDTTKVTIGKADNTDKVRINERMTQAARAYLSDLIDGATQDLTASARISATARNVTDNVAVAFGGGAGALGLPIVTNFIGSDADVKLNNPNIFSRTGDVFIGAGIDSDLSSTLVGAAAGGGAVGLAIGVNEVDTNARVTLTGAQIDADTDSDSAVALIAVRQTKLNSVSVGAGVGGIAGGGAVQVSTLGGTAAVITDRGTQIASLKAAGDLSVIAFSNAEITGTAVGAAVGASGGANSSNVVKLNGDTVVATRGATKLDSGGDVLVRAGADRNVVSKGGAVALTGSVGAGFGLDYLALNEAARVDLGDDTKVFAAGDIEILAASLDEVDSVVASGSGGLFAASLSLAITDIGGASDRDDAQSDVTDEAQDSIGTDGTDDVKKDGEEGDVDAGNSAGRLAGSAGGQALLAESVSKRAAITLDGATTPHGASIKIGKRSHIAGDAVAIASVSEVGVEQLAGAFSLSLSGSLNSGNALASVKSDATIDIASQALVQSNDRTQVVAAVVGSLEDGFTGQDTTGFVNSKAYLGAASLVGALSVAVAKVTVDSDAAINIANDAAFSGSLEDTDGLAKTDELILQATRKGTARADVFNLSVSAFAAVGTSFANSTVTGATEIRMDEGAGGGAMLVKDRITINVTDETWADASAVGASGGILSGNGVDVDAKNIDETFRDADGEITGTRKQRLQIKGLSLITTDDLIVTNDSFAAANADALGVSAGLFAVGASLADSVVQRDLLTEVSATGIVATGTASIQSAFKAAKVKIAEDDATLETNSDAFASSSAGALIAGNGAGVSSELDYQVTTRVGGMISGGSLTVDAASLGTAKVEGKGKQGGLAAIGAVITEVRAPTADVTVELLPGTVAIMSGDVSVTANNAPQLEQLAVSGSGGLVSGAGAGGTTTIVAKTLATNNATRVMAADMTLRAAADIGTVARVSSVNAALVGASGAQMTSTITSTVKTTQGTNTRIQANSLAITAENKIDRPEDPLFNVDSGSGGALDVAAMFAKATITLDTDIDIKDGAKLTQMATRGADDIFQIGLTTDVIFSDRQNLDSSGVLPFPFGDSLIDVKAGDAKVALGDVEIETLGLLDIFAGGNANIRSEVHTSANGLAGVPGALAVANYDAGHLIALSGDTKLNSEDKVSLRAGNVATGQQQLTVKAEARAFNRTAFPIVDEPEGRVSVTTRSSVSVPSGAEVIATGDIDVFADDGFRDAEGFAKGTDLYRAVRDGLSDLFKAEIDGDAVAIESGDRVTVDTSDDKITINGLLRAGARNKRVLAINAAGEVDNTLIGFTAKEAEGIEIQRTASVSLRANLQAQINVLNARLADPGLNSDEAAVAIWTAERRILIERLALDGNTTAPQIEIGNITAREGSIALRADNVLGGSTGQITAPGDALIDIRVAQNAFLVINDLTIPTAEGGIVTFNDTIVANARDVRDQAASGQGVAETSLAVQGFNITSGANTDAPEIIVSTTGDDAAITIEGTVQNLRGAARIISNNSDLEVRGSVQALTPILSATNGNIFVFADPGIAFIGPDPRAQYRSTYFKDVQAAVQDAAHDDRLFSVDGTLVSQRPEAPLQGIEFVSTGLSVFDPVVDADGTAEDKGSILGRNVFLTGEQLNINGLVEAGRFAFNVFIGSTVDRQIADLIDAGGNATTILSSPDQFTVGDVVNNASITSDVTVAWNNRTKRIEIADMVTQGGVVDITGRISSTGGGEIRSLDGFGNVNVDSNSRHAIQLSRIDTGQSDAAGDGVRGVVRITDLNQPLGGGRFLTTEYRRVRGDDNAPAVIRALSNRTFRTEVDEFGNRIEVPTNFEFASNLNDGRRTAFDPVGQDFVVVQTERRVQSSTTTKTESFTFLGIGGRDLVSTVSFDDPVITTVIDEVKNAPYIELNTDDSRSSYRMTSERYENANLFINPEVTDDRNFFGVGDVVTTRETIQTSEVRYSHKIRADLPIAITFAGSNAGDIDVDAVGSVVFTDQIINFTGETDITSGGGSIVAATDLASLRTANTRLLAFGGPVGGLTPGDASLGSIDRALRLDQVEGSEINALAFGGPINLHETKGSMLIGSILAATFDGDNITDSFAVDLTAEGSIRQSEGAGAVIGSELTLEAQTGSIGGSTVANPFLNVGIVDGGITALANGDVQLQAVGLDLPVREITSRTGRIVLRTEEGAIIDANPIERKDLRSEAELVALWTDELGLVGEENAAARLQRAIEAKLDAERALNRQYWDERNAVTDTPPIAFVEDLTLKQKLLDSGLSEAEYANFLAERQARHAEWNAQTAFDPDYAPELSADQVAALSEGIEWTLADLQRSVDLALVTRSASTQIRDEDANLIAAGDIALTSELSIGIGLPEARVLGNGDTTLSGADLALLAAAEISDVRIADGSVFVAQRDDLNVTFTGRNADGTATGSLDALARDGDLLVSTRGPMNIALAASDSLTLLRADGLLTNRDGGRGVLGNRIVLESGGTAGIGLAEQPILIDLVDNGTLAARGAGDIHIAAPASDVALEGIFATGRVTLGANGAITDAFGTGAPRIISDGLTILGGSLGSADRFLKYETTGDALSTILSDGDGFVETDADMNLALAFIEGNGELRTPGKINLVGDTEQTGRIGLGDNSVLVLTAPGGLSASNTRFSDIDGGNVQLRLGGPITATRGRLHTSVNRLDFTSTADEGVDTALRLFNEGALELSVVQNLSPGSVTFVEATGDLTPDLVVSPQMVDLFSRDGAIVEGGINAPSVNLRGATGVGTVDLRVAAVSLTAFTVAGDIKATLIGANGLEPLPEITLQSIVAAGRGNIELTSSASGIAIANGGLVVANDGNVSLVAQNLSLGGQAASISGGDVRLQALGNITMSGFGLANAFDGQVRIRAGGDLEMTRVLAGGNFATAIDINVGGDLRLVGDTDQPRLVANAGTSAGASVTARSLSGPVASDLRHLSTEVQTGPVRVTNIGDLDIGRIVAANGDIDITTERNLTLGDVFAPGNIATLSGRDVLPGAGTFDTAVAFIEAREGDIAGLEVASDGRTLFNLDAARDIVIDETEGDLRIGAANAGRNITVFIPQGALLQGSFQNAERVNLFTHDGVGTQEQAFIAGGRVNAASDMGDINLNLQAGAQPSVIGTIEALGNGDISIDALVPRVALAADGEISSEAGDIRIATQELDLNGPVNSATGSIFVTTAANLNMAPGAGGVSSAMGRVDLDVTGNLELDQVIAGASGLDAIDIDVVGVLSLAGDSLAPRLIAADGATLMADRMAGGPLVTDLARLDVVLRQGDLEVQNVVSLDLVSAIAGNGALRVSADGDLQVRTALASEGEPVTLTAGDDLFGSATFSDGPITLISQGGDIRLTTGDDLDLARADALTGAISIESGGVMTVGTARASDTGELALGALNGLRSRGDGAVLNGGSIELLGREGSVGTAGRAFTMTGPNTAPVLIDGATGINVIAAQDVLTLRAVIAGGDVNVLSEGALQLGSIAARGQTATFSGTDILPGSSFMEADTVNLIARTGRIVGLQVGTGGQGELNLDAALDIQIEETEGDLRIGTARASRTIGILAGTGAIVSGGFQAANEVNLVAVDGLGLDEALVIAGGQLTAATDEGEINLRLLEGEAASTIKRVTQQRNGSINIVAEASGVTLIEDGEITSRRGDIRITGIDFGVDSTILATRGDVFVTTSGNLTMAPVGGVITANLGRVDLDVSGDLALGRVIAGADGLNAIEIEVDGLLSLPGMSAAPRLIAADGARLLAERMEAAPLVTDLARLDANLRQGDLEVQNVVSLDLVSAVAGNGALAVSSDGDLQVRTALASAGWPVTLTAGGDLFGSAMLSDGPVTLISAEGDIRLVIVNDVDLARAEALAGAITIESAGIMTVGTARAADDASLILGALNGLRSRGDGAVLNGGNIELLGRDGSVGATGRAFAMTGPGDAPMVIDGATGINVAADQAGLNLRSALSSNGNVTVRNSGTLTIGNVATTSDGTGILSGSTLISDPANLSGGQFDLIAGSGGIGSEDDAFDLDTSDGALLNLSAAGNIVLSERSGDLRIGTARGMGLVRVETNEGALLSGTVSGGTLVQLGAAAGVTATVEGGTAEVIADAGDIDLTLAAGDAPAALGRVFAAGDGSIRIDAGTLDVTLQEDGAIRSAAGDITLNAGALQANGLIQSDTGDISVTTLRDLTMDGVLGGLRSLGGKVSATAGGDLALAFVQAGAGGADALRLSADGTLGVVPGLEGPRLLAGSGGAIVTVGAFGEGGLTTQLGTLDVQAARGDIEFRNAGALTVTRAVARDGAVAILAGGAMRLTGPVTATGVVDLSASGDLTGNNIDLIGTSVSAFANGDLDLATNAGLRLAEAGGKTVDVFARGDLSVGEVRAQDGGRINLTAENLISIGTAKLTGGRLALTAKGGAIGTDDAPFRVDSNDGATFGLASENITLIETIGNLTLNGAQAQNVTLLAEQGAINNGSIRAKRTVLQAVSGIGAGTRVAIRDGAVSAETTGGNINLLLGDNGTNAGTDKVTLEEVTTSGTGNIVLSGVGSDLTVAAGSGVRTDRGFVFIRSRDLIANAEIQTAGGSIDIGATGDLIQDGGLLAAGGRGNITAGGAVKVTVGGDLELARITSQAEDQLALDINVTGTLRNAPGVTIFRLDADERGAETRLRLGAADPVGPLGLEMQVRALDVVVERGDLHVNNQRTLRLRNAETKAGSLEIFAGSELVFERAKAAPGRALILASSGNVLATDGVADADIIGIYAFTGGVRGDGAAAMTVDTKAGARVQIFAQDEVNLREITGDLTLAYAISEDETLDITGPGAVTVGLAGAAKALNIAADGALSVGRIGGASVAIDDPVALQLVRDDFYRTVAAPAPSTVTLMSGAALNAGIITAQSRVALSGSSIAANLVDATPGDGLSVGATGVGDGFAGTVDIAVLGAGPAPVLSDPLAANTGSVAGFATQHAGAVTFDGLRIGGPGLVANLTTGGPSVAVRNAVIAGDVRFEQRGFSVLVQTALGPRSDLDDIHVVTEDGNTVDFSLANGRDFTATGLTVLNKVVTEDDAEQQTIAEVVDDLIRQTANIDEGDEVVAASFVLEEEEPGTSRRVLRIISITVRTPRGEQIVRLPLISAALPGNRGTQVN